MKASVLSAEDSAFNMCIVSSLFILITPRNKQLVSCTVDSTFLGHRWVKPGKLTLVTRGDGGAGGDGGEVGEEGGGPEQSPTRGRGSWWRGRRSHEVPIDAHQAPRARPHFVNALLTLSPERHLYFRLLLFLEPCRKVSSSVGQRQGERKKKRQQQQFNRKTGRPLGNKRAGRRRSRPPPAWNRAPRNSALPEWQLSLV